MFSPYEDQDKAFTKSFLSIHAQPDGLIVLSIHLFISLLPLYPELGYRVSSLSSDMQTSLTPVTASSTSLRPLGVHKPAERCSPSSSSWVFLKGLFKVGPAWKTSSGSFPVGNWNWATSAGLIWRSSSSSEVTKHLTLSTVQPANLW